MNHSGYCPLLKVNFFCLWRLVDTIYMFLDFSGTKRFTKTSYDAYYLLQKEVDRYGS